MVCKRLAGVTSDYVNSLQALFFQYEASSSFARLEIFNSRGFWILFIEYYYWTRLAMYMHYNNIHVYESAMSMYVNVVNMHSIRALFMLSSGQLVYALLQYSFAV